MASQVNPDMRLRLFALRARPAPKTQRCLQFFMYLYLRLGETLPHKFHGKCFRSKARRRGKPVVESESSADEAPVSILEESKQEVIAEASRFMNYISTGMGTDLSGPQAKKKCKAGKLIIQTRTSESCNRENQF